MPQGAADDLHELAEPIERVGCSHGDTGLQPGNEILFHCLICRELGAFEFDRHADMKDIGQINRVFDADTERERSQLLPELLEVAPADNGLQVHRVDVLAESVPLLV